jgi:hypothetical protein
LYFGVVEEAKEIQEIDEAEDPPPYFWKYVIQKGL